MSPAEAKGPTSRRRAIRDLIRGQRIATQEQLRQSLSGQGFEVTQATLSRDLARLGARHVSLPQGGTVYELGDAPTESPFAKLRGIVQHVRDNGALVVVQTEPGAAQAVARSIDLSHLPGILGSIAGDDTIFVAPAKGVGAQRLRRELQKLFTL